MSWMCLSEDICLDLDSSPNSSESKSPGDALPGNIPTNFSKKLLHVLSYFVHTDRGACEAMPVHRPIRRFCSWKLWCEPHDTCTVCLFGQKADRSEFRGTAVLGSQNNNPNFCTHSNNFRLTSSLPNTLTVCSIHAGSVVGLGRTSADNLRLLVQSVTSLCTTGLSVGSFSAKFVSAGFGLLFESVSHNITSWNT